MTQKVKHEANTLPAQLILLTQTHQRGGGGGERRTLPFSFSFVHLNVKWKSKNSFSLFAIFTILFIHAHTHGYSAQNETAKLEIIFLYLALFELYAPRKHDRHHIDSSLKLLLTFFCSRLIRFDVELKQEKNVGDTPRKKSQKTTVDFLYSIL